MWKRRVDVDQGSVVPADGLVTEAESRRPATVGASWISPRTSRFVSRFFEYRMPPGARTLLLVTVLTTSVKVKPDDVRALGLTLIWIDGVTTPLSWTNETPGTCSIAGTILLIVRSPGASDPERMTSEVTTASLGL